MTDAADQRDVAADERDAAADRRDEAAEGREVLLPERGDALNVSEFGVYQHEYKREIAARRSDRRHAADDRKHAKGDREAAHDDRTASTPDGLEAEADS